MTHGERVLHALRDNEWHTTAWLYANGCQNMILHSRVSDLRKKGHNVEGRHVPGQTGAHGYAYRLLPSVTYVDVPQRTRPPVDSLPRVPEDEQLTILVPKPPVPASYYDI